MNVLQTRRPIPIQAISAYRSVSLQYPTFQVKRISQKWLNLFGNQLTKRELY